MRKRTSKTRRYRHHAKVLKSEVMSPRIAWFNFLGFMKLVTKVAAVLAVVAGIGYGIRQAIEHTFHQNPDFRLQAISLSQNDVFDEPALVEYLMIDLSGNIFDFDIGQLETRLLEIPAISSAKVERNLPGTLEFRITTRKPVAWIACPEENFPATRDSESLLVDIEGYTYPCPPGQLSDCKALPILLLTPHPEHPIRPGTMLEHPQYKHSLHLLKTIIASQPEDIPSIESISQENAWSLTLKTYSGTVATFGLGNHGQQLENLARAIEHSRKKGYQIATINLIPRQNVPITVRGDENPPRAIPVSEEIPPEPSVSRRTNDIRSLLNRN